MTTMTLEKLAELEALEAAATPGPFSLVGGMRKFVGVRAPRAGCYVWRNVDSEVSDECVARWVADAELHIALRNNARDLFAALREAWRERDEAYKRAAEYRGDCIAAENRLDSLIAAIRAASGPNDDPKGAQETMIAAGAEIEKLSSQLAMAVIERDEARAALDQLRAAEVES